MADKQFSIPLDFPSSDGVSHINAKLWTSTKYAVSTEDAATTQTAAAHPAGAPAMRGWRSATAGAQASIQTYTPGVTSVVTPAGAIKPRAIVQIVHGMAEHINRYDDLAEYLVSQGFVVCAEDHIGHGGSVGEGQEFGHMPAYDGKDILLADVDTLRTMVSALYPGVPYVMYGHSMGSFIVRAYIARKGEGLAACVLSGTGNVPAPLSHAGRSLARLLGRVRSGEFRSSLVDNLGVGAYGKQIDNAQTQFDWLSTNHDVVKAYIEDELCGFMFTVGGYATLLDLTAEVVTSKCAKRVPKDLPVLFIAGDKDPVGENGKGVLAAQRLLRDAGVKTVDAKLYPGMRHEVHNEVGYQQVYNDVVSWVQQHIE